jgi:hypothetical protein
MKSKVLAVASVLFMGSTGLALAQKATPTVGVGSGTHQLGIRFHQDVDQIQKDKKSGKLSASEAKVLWGQIKGIRSQELNFFKANGKKQLTDAQAVQLGSQLDVIDKSL